MVWGFGKQNGNAARADEATDATFYALQDAPGDPWAARLEQIDRYLDRTKPPESKPAAGDAPRAKHGKGWWIVRGLGVLFGLFVLTVLWLAITAPLSKSLQPIAPPEVTLLAADGTPIARTGAIVDKPVSVAKLPPRAAQPLNDRARNGPDQQRLGDLHRGARLDRRDIDPVDRCHEVGGEEAGIGDQHHHAGDHEGEHRGE